MTKLLFLMALLCPVLSVAAPKKKDLKLEATYAPQFFQLSQKSDGEKATGSGFIYKNAQINVRWKLDKVELDLDYRFSDFMLKAEDKNLDATMQDISLGVTYRNVFLRLEHTISPFIEVTNNNVNVLDLKNNWLTLGYRKIIMPFWRVGGGVSYLLTSDLESYNVKSQSGYKGNAWIERWVELKKLNLLLSLRLFGEARFMELDTNYAPNSTDVQTTHFGMHLGIAKVF